MACIACGGSGCSECNKEGRIDITGCPLEIIDNEVWEVIEYAELYEKGLPPVAGGALDQARNFIEACGYIFSLRAYLKKKMKAF